MFQTKAIFNSFFLNLSVGEIAYRDMEEIQIKYWPKYQFSQQPQKDGRYL